MDTKWFKNRMREQGVTQEKLGSLLGRERSVVSKIINGHQPIKLNEASILARALAVSSEEVLSHAGLSTTDVIQAPADVANLDDLSDLVRLAFLEVNHATDQEDMNMTRNDWAETLQDQFRILYALKYDDGLENRALEAAGQAVASNIIRVKFAKR